MLIQANKVDLGQGTSLAQVLNPFTDNSFMGYVRNAFQENYGKVAEMTGQVGEVMQGMFNYFTSDNFVNTGREIAMQVGIRNDNTIHGVNCETINNAGMVMAGYIMANPVIYDMYSKYRIDGYNDMFTMQEPNIGDVTKSIEYMQVTDGIVQYNNDGYEYNSYSYNGEHLVLREQLTVLDAWDCAEVLIEHGIDPTSREKDELWDFMSLVLFFFSI